MLISIFAEARWGPRPSQSYIILNFDSKVKNYNRGLSIFCFRRSFHKNFDLTVTPLSPFIQTLL